MDTGLAVVVSVHITFSPEIIWADEPYGSGFLGGAGPATVAQNTDDLLPPPGQSPYEEAVSAHVAAVLAGLAFGEEPAAPSLDTVTPEPPPLSQWSPFPCQLAVGYQDSSTYLRPHLDPGGKPLWAVPARVKDLDAVLRHLYHATHRTVARGYTRMSREKKTSWLTAWLSGDMAGCYSIEAQACLQPSRCHPGHPSYPDTHWLIWAPAVDGEAPAGVSIPGNWPPPDKNHWHADTCAHYLWAARMAHPRHLTGAQRRAWCRAHLNADKPAVDALSLAAQRAAHSGKVGFGSVVGPRGGARPEEDYRPYLKSGLAVAAWGTGALRNFARDRLLPEVARYPALLDQVDAQVRTEAALRAERDAELHLVRAPEQPDLGGYHPKILLSCQRGRLWLFKPAPDPAAAFRPETEHAAHLLARRWGYPTAASHLLSVEGQYGQAQAWLAPERSLAGFTGDMFATLTEAQLCALAREHLLDWALDNDDSHGENMLLLPDAMIVGIDKGRAWRYFGGWAGLYPDSRANSNAPLIYTSLYRAIAAHQLPRATAEAMFRDVIIQAHRMQRLPDAELAALIHAGVAHRPHYRPSHYQSPVPGAPTNAEELVAAATARKNRLAQDMTLLWQRVFAAAGWELPTVTLPRLGLNNQGHPLYSGLHEPELHAAVAATKSYGTSCFFAGTALEDAHLLLWRERRPDASFLVRAQGKVRGSALSAMVAWCTAHSPDPQPASTDELDHLYEAIIAAARTVSYHAEDKAYNPLTMRRFSEAQSGLQAILTATQGHPDTPWWRERRDACLRYLEYCTRVRKHQEQGTASVEGDFPRHTPGSSAPQPVPPPGPSVSRQAAQRDAATIGHQPVWDEDGELRLCGDLLHDGGGNCGQAGQRWLITLPDGETLALRGSDRDTETPRSQEGLLDITIPDPQDLAASLHRVQAHLQSMGLPLTPATPTDLHLFYWRHLGGILSDRCDTAPSRALSSTVRQFHARRPTPASGLDPAGELAAWHEAFAPLCGGPQQLTAFLAGEGWLPRFLHMDTRAPQQPSGHPYWERFDVPVAVALERAMPALRYKSGPLNAILTGACLSTEDRLQQLALWKAGMSSADDLSCGSGAFVFTRQNVAGIDRTCNIFFSPRVLLRTSNYAMPTDNFGRVLNRRDLSPWNFQNASGFADPTNELMIKHALSVLDDIEVCLFEVPADRKRCISLLAARGITELRGVPVADRFLMHTNADLSAGLYRARVALSAAAHRTGV